MTITHEEISQRARQIWEREGRPEGRDVEHWLQAEEELRRESQGSESARETVSSQPRATVSITAAPLAGETPRKRASRRVR